MSLKRIILNGALWASGGQVFSMACNFALMLVLARGLSPADYGLYFVALNTVAIMVNVGAVGMDRVVVRFASMRIANHDLAGLRRLVFSCLATVLVGAAITCLAFLLFAHLFFARLLNMPELTLYLGVITLWMFSATVQGQFTETFRGLNDIRLAALLGGVRTNGILNALVVCLLVTVSWVAGQLTLTVALWIMLATSVLIIAFSWITLLRQLHHSDADKAEMHATPAWSKKDALRESWPYWLAAIITALRLQGVAWLAGGMDTTAHVALFAVAQRMMVLLTGPMIISNAVLPPIVAQLHSSNQLQKLERVIRSISGLILLPCLVVLSILVFGGRIMLHDLFGAYYGDAYPLMIVLCAGQVLNIATGAWQTVMPMTGHKDQMLITSAIALVTQLSLGLILGRSYGVMGVAIGFSASIAITNVVGMLFVHKRLGVWTFASLDLKTLKDATSLVAERFGRKTNWQNS
jgi:O-antigen/teichoic acid export membrane protein